MLLELIVAVLVILVFLLLLFGSWLYWGLRNRLNAHIRWSQLAHGWITRSVGGPGDGTPPASPPPDELG